jgi:peptide/nickel transport system substrate-binding protein
LFDEVVILSSRSKLGSKAVLGPFYVADYRAGSFVLLKRNPNYWKRDAAGRRLPYLESVRLEIQSNRGLEALRFTRGEVQLINSVDPQFFDRLPAAAVHDIGPSLDPEMMWFNQVPTAPVSAYKRAWFRSRNFRRAVLTAIDRDAICRVVYGGHARPAIGPISPANEFWFNQKLKPLNFDRSGALALLAQDGFHLSGGILHDAQAHEVEFSLITNAGNEPRARMAAMIQQDLAAIGIHVNVVTLDFASLIDRITRSFDYESCLLGPINSDLDPNAQMNEWLSSAPNHQWNPSQKTPASPWEAEIDRLMRLQASTTDRKSRKAAFDRVQQIAWDEAPFLSLVNKDALCAISPNVQSAQPVVLRPQTYWNIEHLSLGAQLALK